MELSKEHKTVVRNVVSPIVAADLAVVRPGGHPKALSNAGRHGLGCLQSVVSCWWYAIRLQSALQSAPWSYRHLMMTLLSGVRV